MDFLVVQVRRVGSSNILRPKVANAFLLSHSWTLLGEGAVSLYCIKVKQTCLDIVLSQIEKLYPQADVILLLSYFRESLLYYMF